MPRGGYQKPSKPASSSGPGKFSERTDGGPVKPSLDDPSVQYGDVGMLERAAQQSPIKGSQGASVGGRKATGSPATRRGIPPFLTAGEDPHPEEPTTTGLGMGAGAGPEVLDAAQPSDDVKETVLEALAMHFGNQAAAQMLADMRAERSSAMPQMPTLPSLGGGLPEPEAAATEQPMEV